VLLSAADSGVLHLYRTVFVTDDVVTMLSSDESKHHSLFVYSVMAYGYVAY